MSRFKQFSLVAVCASTMVLSACVNDDSGSEPEGVSSDNFDFVDMMTNYADNIIIPNYQGLAQTAADFSAESGALANYCASIGTGSESTERAQALTAWQDLQTAIQRSEIHILGPVLDNGGLLLNRINPYNSSELSSCGIDQAVVLADQDVDFDITSRTTNQRGIGTLEYLLFNENLSHTCPSQITETVDWNARTEQERRQLRCDYAQVVAEDLANNSVELADAWVVDGGNYRSTFVNPNNISTSLSALSDALFYLDVDVKDRKLGVPTGINNTGCGTISCADEVESPYAEASFALVRGNLVSFKTLFTGGDGLGFDDIIDQAGVSDLNDRMLSNADEAIAMIDSMSVSLRDQATAIITAEDEAGCANAFANPGDASAYPACSLYGAVKTLTDDLKVDFVAAVDVDLPDRAQSDND